MSLSALSAIEQYSQYLMGMKSKHILNLHFESTMNRYNNSWEEKAFADDAARPLGGFIWPPRSYSCSFCKREFRSAQALGGHMNVHRRDRARLKQALSPQNGVLHPCKSLDASYPSQVCFIDSNPNPSFLASAHSPSRVSAISTQENFSEDTYVSPFSSSIVQEQLKESPHSSTPSWSDSKAAWLFSGPDSKTAFEKNVRKEDFRDDCVETNLSMGLNLVFSQNHPSGFDGDDEAITRKRHKTIASSIPFFLKRSSDETYGSMEDLDLELRLGDPPTVK